MRLTPAQQAIAARQNGKLFINQMSEEQLKFATENTLLRHLNASRGTINPPHGSGEDAPGRRGGGALAVREAERLVELQRPGESRGGRHRRLAPEEADRRGETRAAALLERLGGLPGLPVGAGSRRLLERGGSFEEGVDLAEAAERIGRLPVAPRGAEGISGRLEIPGRRDLGAPKRLEALRREGRLPVAGREDLEPGDGFARLLLLEPRVGSGEGDEAMGDAGLCGDAVQLHGRQVVEVPVARRGVERALRGERGVLGRGTPADGDDSGEPVGLQGHCPREDGPAGESARVDPLLVDGEAPGDVGEERVDRPRVGGAGAVAAGVVRAREHPAELVGGLPEELHRDAAAPARVEEEEDRPAPGGDEASRQVELPGQRRLGESRDAGRDGPGGPRREVLRERFRRARARERESREREGRGSPGRAVPARGSRGAHEGLDGARLGHAPGSLSSVSTSGTARSRAPSPKPFFVLLSRRPPAFRTSRATTEASLISSRSVSTVARPSTRSTARGTWAFPIRTRRQTKGRVPRRQRAGPGSALPVEQVFDRDLLPLPGRAGDGVLCPEERFHGADRLLREVGLEVGEEEVGGGDTVLLVQEDVEGEARGEKVRELHRRRRRPPRGRARRGRRRRRERRGRAPEPFALASATQKTSTATTAAKTAAVVASNPSSSAAAAVRS